MIVVSFYSYKGGTGRTTLLANTAFQLARRGKKVLCLDFDIDGPGLMHVLQLAPAAILRHNIIALLSGEGGSGPGIDIAGHIIPWVQDIGGTRVQIDCISAPTGTEEQRKLENYSGAELAARVNQICAQAEGKPAYDFLLIDSSSGFDTYTSLAFGAADLTLVCFRWSLQHIQGTFEACNLLGAMLKRNQEAHHQGHSKPFLLKDFWLVASGVPIAESEVQKARQASVEHELRDEAREIHQEASVPIEQTDIIKITEDNDLKWLEEIVVTERRSVFAEFDALASKLVKMAENYRGSNHSLGG